MHRLIVSAPFGNHLEWPGVTSTIGTYTLARRAGPWLRLWRALSTVRYSWRSRSWINRLGLPSPGIDSVDPWMVDEKILSVHGFDAAEWRQLALRCHRLQPVAIELNLSCPNVGHSGSELAAEVESALPYLTKHGSTIVAKLPPIRWVELAMPLFEAGCRAFHCCNTIPTPGGGLSGKPLKQYSLWAVEDLRRRFGSSVALIGGGGVTCAQDARDYLSAGADHVAVASMLLNPLNWRKVEEIRDAIA